MADSASNFADAVLDAGRRMATGQGQAVSRYGELLTKLGARDIDLIDFTRETTQLGIEASARLAEDVMQVNIAYWRLLSEMLGTAVSQAAKTTSTPRAND